MIARTIDTIEFASANPMVSHPAGCPSNNAASARLMRGEPGRSGDVENRRTNPSVGSPGAK